MRSLAPWLCIATLGLAAASRREARGDEIRLVDGEILHGEVVEETETRIVLRVGEARRAIRADAVARREAAEAPDLRLGRVEAALTAEDQDGRIGLARFAWSRRLDADAQRLARQVLVRDADHAGAHRLLGHVRRADGWVEGWPAPWPPAGSTGPRWGRERRRPSGAPSTALAAALDWLARHQDGDGRIDADGFEKHCPAGDACGGVGGGHHGERVPCAFDGAVTALAVLAWLADGSTPGAGPYGSEVARGLAFLASEVETGPRGFDGIWNQAFALQALADACAATRSLDLRERVETAIGSLLTQQRPDGGWSYVYAIGDVPTTSIVLQTLGLVAQVGIGVDPEAVGRGLSFLESRVESKTGRSEYHEGAEQKGYTPTTANGAATLAARAMLGVQEGTDGLSRRLGTVTASRPRWSIEFKEVETRDGRTVRAQVGTLYPYAWYQTRLALTGRWAARARTWRTALDQALVEGQAQAGHGAGSWEPLGPYSLSGGRVFVTALGALMLQADHRYP